MKILMIEEERMLADSLKALLVTKGFDVDVVYDKQTGIECAMLGLFDLLILDAEGIQIAERIREKHFPAPIIMLAAKSEVENFPN